MVLELVTTWFHWLEQWGYAGVFILMAMESTIIPIPSELVMAPAAFWAMQGKMNFPLVIFFGAVGSYFGSAASYWFARLLGQPFLHRFGKYFFISEKHLKLAEDWMKKYGVVGVLFARVLPVIRHVISMPAGIFRMNFRLFSLVTIVGASLWCTILAWFGRLVIGDRPELLNSPEEMVGVIKDRMIWFVIGVLILFSLYFFVVHRRGKKLP